MNKEIRQSNVEIGKIKAIDDKKMKIEGYALKFNENSQVIEDGDKKFIETVQSGAFKESINSSNDVDLLFQHDDDKILASTKNNTLKLEEDNKGLRFEAELIDTNENKDVYEKVKSELYDKISIGFTSPESRWSKISNNLYKRTISKLNLLEISIVRKPAYESSSVFAREVEAFKEEIKKEGVVEEMEKERIEEILKGFEELKKMFNKFAELLEDDGNKDESDDTTDTSSEKEKEDDLEDNTDDVEDEKESRDDGNVTDPETDPEVEVPELPTDPEEPGIDLKNMDSLSMEMLVKRITDELEKRNIEEEIDNLEEI